MYIKSWHSVSFQNVPLYFAQDFTVYTLRGGIRKGARRGPSFPLSLPIMPPRLHLNPSVLLLYSSCHRAVIHSFILSSQTMSITVTVTHQGPFHPLSLTVWTGVDLSVFLLQYISVNLWVMFHWPSFVLKSSAVHKGMVHPKS